LSETTPTQPAPAQRGPVSVLLANAASILAILALAIAGGIWLWNAFHDRGYAPDQPIAFSHKRHVGDLKMDCAACHFNAERGKHAGVPPMSVCMGCHNQVATDKPEIQKLAQIASQGSYTDADGVVREGGVVHWARVHKLPDHVYFNHKAHVDANVSCKTCHGPVETMGLMRQHATLTMSWCLECHRRTNYAKDGVGAPSNAAARANERPDPLVVFHERIVKGAKPATAHHDDVPAAIAGKPLPASHAELMNAPTQCSTCHQ
jgi:hypothetical protein